MTNIPTKSLLTVLTLIGGLLLALHSAAAQDEVPPWSTPVNLSQSGAASDTVGVVDSNQVVHILWQDNVLGFVYVHSQEIEAEEVDETEAVESDLPVSEWTTPVAVELPFVSELTAAQQSAGQTPALFVPQLRADADGRIHAFWLDNEDALLHSAVLAESFGNPSAWSDPVTVAEGVLRAAADIGDSGSLNVAYILAAETDDLAAGVYYRRRNSQSNNWAAAVLLDQSAYFRTLPVEQANVGVAVTTVGEIERIYVVWDHPPLDRVYLAQSDDAGQTWQDAHEIDRRRPDDDQTAVSPSKIQVAASGSELHLFWQAGHQGLICQQLHQWSADGGQTWEAAQPMLADLDDACPTSNSILIGAGGELFLLADVEHAIPAGVFLLAWDGQRWSDAQEQEPLLTFVDPETHKTIELGCLQALLTAERHSEGPDEGPGEDSDEGLAETFEERLIVLGCNSGLATDVWLLTRSLTDLASWFPPPAAWQTPQVLATAASEILLPVAVTDEQGWIHLLWHESGSAQIRYVRWDGIRWSTPLPVLTSPGGQVSDLDAVVTPDGRILVAWTDADLGQLYFSQTAIARALFAEYWATPQLIPLVSEGAGTPTLAIDAGNGIHIAYAIPINEGRGIYLIQSGDLGRTWSEPVLVFDGATAGWALVRQPQLALIDDQQMHLIWRRESLGVEPLSLALAYARSGDGGQSWSEAQIVVETAVTWSQIAGVFPSTVHRAWQEASADQVAVWHQVSQDGGLSWSHPSLVASSALDEKVVGLVRDIAGQIHLVFSSSQRLQHRQLSGARWLVEESLPLSRLGLDNLTTLALTTATDGNLAAVYVGLSTQDAGDDLQEARYILSFTSRFLELPDDLPPPPPTATATPLPTVTATPTPSPLPTPTVALPPEVNENEQNQLFASTTELLLVTAVLPAGLLILLVILAWIRQRKLSS